MKPAVFDYLRAECSGHVLDTLAEHRENARLLAGGQSLAPMLNMRLVTPKVVVDLQGLKGHGAIRESDGAVEVGALVTQAELLRWPGLASRAPLLAQALPHVGHYQTRSRGTVCGSIAHADPSAEIPLCLAMSRGEVTLMSRRGTRTLPAPAFQLGLMTTSRDPDEMIVSARFPVARPGTGQVFREVGARRGDFAMVAIAAEAREDGIRVGIGGVGDRPVIRDWPALSASELDDALNDLAWDLGATGDVHATARYRRELVRRLGRRAVEEAKACRS